VLDAALGLLDLAGLDGLTTRRLAERLGVRSPSLYWHFKSKEELLQLLAEHIAGEVPIPDPALPWRGRLEALMQGFRSALARHRDAALIFVRSVPLAPNFLAIAETAVTALLEGGLAEDEAVRAVGILVGYVTGFALDEAVPDVTGAAAEEYERFLSGLPKERYPQLSRLAFRLGRPPRDEQFAFGVRVLLDGLEAQAAGR
jgi:TetR/AcrR family tetracycline transcriptional repressor